MKTILLALMATIFISCETKEYDPLPSSTAVQNSASSTFGSNASFSGLDGITSVTDTSAILFWTNSDEAQEYYIYDVTDGINTLLHRAQAGETTYTATKLKSATSYTFLVRLKDIDAQLDNNINKMTITTNAQPETPNLSLAQNIQFPTKQYDVQSRPYLTVSNIQVGDTIKIYTDSNCSSSNLVGSAISDGSSINIQLNKLPSFGDYDFYVKSTNINGVESNCSTNAIEYDYNECPSGYILVPADSGNELVANDFCVMKFEAKPWLDSGVTGLANSSDLYGLNDDGCLESSCSSSNWGTSFFNPGSFELQNGDVYPGWRKLDMQTAKDECRSLGDGYDLINSYEWMTIARNIEAQANNWSSGIVGSGCVFRGNNGIDDSCGYNYNGVDGRAEVNRTGTATYARHTLSNGNQIWDFAGNLAEWVDTGSLDQDEAQLGPIDCTDGWVEFGSIEICDKEPDGDSDLAQEFFAPGNPANITEASYNSDFGLGQFEGGTGGAAIRGGSYRNGYFAGIFSLSFSAFDDDASKEYGFRCVYRRN
ncbi:MAG: hypothetical protein CME65_02395 [Halobacteriovoraceae bacterium]|nr:hypothetical protein [Halobacteriovoraceae bacterium]|tara:strand:+ start:8394 stop:10007 length:1614 start_codon:yes stop_codon:yes gene_type:complete